MCIRDRPQRYHQRRAHQNPGDIVDERLLHLPLFKDSDIVPVSYTHLRAHETVLDLVCRLLLEKKNQLHKQIQPAT